MTLRVAICPLRTRLAPLLLLSFCLTHTPIKLCWQPPKTIFLLPSPLRKSSTSLHFKKERARPSITHNLQENRPPYPIHSPS